MLPNLFSAFIVLIGVANGILFLEETHVEKKMQRDRGLELGEWLLSALPDLRKCTEVRDEKLRLAEMSEVQRLIPHDEQLPGYRTNENSPENSPRLKSTTDSRLLDAPLDLARDAVNSTSGMSTTFTRTVVLNIVSFGILAL